MGEYDNKEIAIGGGIALIFLGLTIFGIINCFIEVVESSTMLGEIVTAFAHVFGTIILLLLGFKGMYCLFAFVDYVINKIRERRDGI